MYLNRLRLDLTYYSVCTVYKPTFYAALSAIKPDRKNTKAYSDNPGFENADKNTYLLYHFYPSSPSLPLSPPPNEIVELSALLSNSNLNARNLKG
jgi:hypothetical protein